MRNTSIPYRLLSLGLIFALITSFSLPAMMSCVMAANQGQNDQHESMSCCDKMDKSTHCDSEEEKENHQGHDGSECSCTFKQAPKHNETVMFDQAQVSKLIVTVASFIVTQTSPPVVYRENARDHTTLYTASSPIYLMNRVLLN
ncbi:MAG: hypothetical protein WD267_10370 [Balneolales bacterium]